MQGILMIGPREWGSDHLEHLKSHPFTSMQYTATNLNDVRMRLPKVLTPFPLFIYTPKNYKNTPNGSQTIEFACRVIDYKIFSTPAKSPWPTINGPKWYDNKQDSKYELWFKVDVIEKCKMEVTDFIFYKKDGSNCKYETVAKFIGPARGRVLFASSYFEFTEKSFESIATSNLRTEEVTHGNLSSISDEEGKKKIIQHVSYERSARNRRQAIEIHGTTCMVCGFDFDSFYGEDIAKQYIEVHHIVPLHSKQKTVDPEKDLVCVCSNCHSMLHRRKDTLISIKELQNKINKQK